MQITVAGVVQAYRRFYFCLRYVHIWYGISHFQHQKKSVRPTMRRCPSVIGFGAISQRSLGLNSCLLAGH